MQIDWFTFIAQIINFLIVLVLLRRFLFGPIVRAMAEREAQIAARFAAAEEQREQAHKEGQLFREQRHELETERDRLLAEVKAQATDLRKTLLNDARQEVENERTRWLAAIEHQRQEILHDLRARVGDRVVQICRRALGDLAQADLEQSIIAVFLEQLQQLEPSPPGNGSSANDAKEGEQVITVRSTFALSAETRDKIAAAIEAQFGSQATRQPAVVEFEITKELICGIGVQLRHRHVNWNVRDYLDALEDTLDQEFMSARAATDDERVLVHKQVGDDDRL